MPTNRPAAASMLRDGSRVSDLIDMEAREVSLRVFDDPEIYELEQELIFARAWTVLGHVSEIPNPGDFVLRYIGEDQLIVSRAKDGSIHAALNVCTHRGAKVCRFDRGNAGRFQCPYHGWTFAPDGTFMGAPIGKEQMHGDIRDKAELGLATARVDTCVGMIFATFDEDAPSLDSYLGAAKWYLDLIWDRTEGGFEVAGSPQRFNVPANWKAACEQAGGDIFHGMNLHRSLAELGSFAQDRYGSKSQTSSKESLDSTLLGVSANHDGHFVYAFEGLSGLQGLADGVTVAELLKRGPLPSMSAEMIDDLVGRRSEDDLRMNLIFRRMVGATFPNVQMFCSPATISWRVYVPKGPHRFEQVNWCLVERDAPEEIREMTVRASLMTFGSSGMIESDDSDTWPWQTAAARGAIGRRQKLRYQALRGETNRPAEWTGPGSVYSGLQKDDNQWAWWTRYREFMSGEPWGEPAPASP